MCNFKNYSKIINVLLIKCLSLKKSLISTLPIPWTIADLELSGISNILITHTKVPKLYNSLGIFLPLITVNCSILGASVFMNERGYTLGESAVFGFSSGIGFYLAIVCMAAIRFKLRYSNIPDGLKGLGITMILTGLLSMAYLSFSGIQL